MRQLSLGLDLHGEQFRWNETKRIHQQNSWRDPPMILSSPLVAFRPENFNWFLLITVTPIPETSPMVERSNAVSAMCQQLSQGLSLLSSTDDPFLVDNKVNVSSFIFLFSYLVTIELISALNLLDDHNYQRISIK